MAPRTRSQAVKAETHDNERPEAKPAAKKRARAAAPKTSRARKKLRQEDESADEGRDSSRAFLATSRKGAKSIKQAKRDLRRKTAEVVKLIEGQLRSEEPASERQSFMDCLTSEFAPCLPYAASNIPIGVETRNDLYKKSQDCFVHFQAIAQEYEAVNKCPTDIRRPPWGLWEQDIKDLRALNENALGLAFDALSSIVMPNARGKVAEGPCKKDDEIGAMALELIAEAKPNKTDDVWGTVAQGLLRALSAVVMMLPKTDES